MLTTYFYNLKPAEINLVLLKLLNLRTPDNYIESIITAINVGGDVDTTATMTGAITGTFVGIKEIPSNLAQQLTDQDTWGFDELVDLINTCYKIKFKAIKKITDL